MGGLEVEHRLLNKPQQNKLSTSPLYFKHEVRSPICLCIQEEHTAIPVRVNLRSETGPGFPFSAWTNVMYHAQLPLEASALERFGHTSSRFSLERLASARVETSMVWALSDLFAISLI